MFTTADTTVYAICPGRGFADAATVLGTHYDGVLVRDGWVSYRCFRDAKHQSCLAHLLRRAQELQKDHPVSNGGTLEHAQQSAGHASPKTTNAAGTFATGCQGRGRSFPAWPAGRVEPMTGGAARTALTLLTFDG